MKQRKIPPTKTCTKCRTAQDISEFLIRKGGKRHSWCRSCTNQCRKDKYWSDPEYRERIVFQTRGNHIAERYGITHLEYLQKQAAQDYRCAICGKRAFGRELHLDHCHITGKVRDFLCKPCNIMLGRYNDDPKLLTELLTKAIQYLERHRDEEYESDMIPEL